MTDFIQKPCMVMSLYCVLKPLLLFCRCNQSRQTECLTFMIAVDLFKLCTFLKVVILKVVSGTFKPCCFCVLFSVQSIIPCESDSTFFLLLTDDSFINTWALQILGFFIMRYSKAIGFYSQRHFGSNLGQAIMAHTCNPPLSTLSMCCYITAGFLLKL